MPSQLTLALGLCALVSWSGAAKAHGSFDVAGIDVARGYLPRMLVKSPGEHGSTGIDIGPDGRLWVVSIVDHHVRAENRFTGENDFELGFEDGVRTPDDIAVAPDGTVFWTEFIPGRVKRLTPDGVTTTIATIGEGADGIAVSDDGRLFVNRFLSGDELYEIDPEGVSPPRLVVAGVPGMEAMDVGADGAVYVPLIFDGVVVRIDPDSGTVETVFSGLVTPIAVEFDAAGRLYVLENQTGRILRGDAATGVVGFFADGGVGLDNLAFDGAGRLFVSNAMTGAIVQVGPNGSLRTVQRGGLNVPGGLAFTRVDGKLQLFVADYTSTSAYDPLTGRQTTIVPQTFADPSVYLSLPLTVAALGNDLLYSSWISNTVQIWDPESETVAALYDDFAVPTNAIGFHGDVVVAELGTGSVVRLNRGTGARETVASGLTLPAGLATNGESIWVADAGTGNVWKIVAKGEPLESPLAVATGLLEPEGLALDRHGRLLVVETGARKLVAIHPRTGAREVIARGLPIDIPASEESVPPQIFNGITTDPFGHIYVSLDARRAVLQLLDSR